MISQIIGSGTTSVIGGNSALACWLRDAVTLFLEIGLLAWLVFTALAAILLFPEARRDKSCAT